MRRLLLVVLSLIVVLLIGAIIVVGLKTPEMPLKEVHKVLPVEKFKPQVQTPKLPVIMPNAQSLQVPPMAVAPTTSGTQPVTVPGSSTNAPNNPAVVTPTVPATPPVAPAAPVSPPIVVSPSGQVPGNAAVVPSASPIVAPVNPPVTVPAVSAPAHP